MSFKNWIDNRWSKTVLLLLLSMPILSQAAGLLQPSNTNLPPLEIRDHRVSVVIEDGYAITRVDQIFHNPHNQDLEAHYSFPVPEHATVAELTLWIDGMPVTGEVLERQRAKKVYAEEKAAGRDSGITEKTDYKRFETRIAPVRGGENTRLRLVYLQPATVDTGIGRYLYPLEEGGVDEEKLAFWTANEQVTGHFSFDLWVRSAYPVDAVRMPNHPQAQIRQTDAGEWHIRLGHQSPSSATSGEKAELTGEQPKSVSGNAGETKIFKLDKDLVVYWRHKSGLPGSVDLVAHKPGNDKRGTFMLVVTPGDDLQPIEKGKDWVFILDISGSMKGKYSTLTEGIQRALKKMLPEDRFRIIVFNNSSRELTPGFVNVSAKSVSDYSRRVAAITPNSGTNLYSGLQRGLGSLDADRTSALILVTDGVANVGETRQREFIDLIKQKDIRLFTFIMGNSANRPLLESMTQASNGFAESISNSDDIVGKILSAAKKVSHQALHGVKLSIKGVRTADITPAEIGSLYRGQQLVLFGHYWGGGNAEVTLSGRISGQEKSYQSRFLFPHKANENPEIERLWAYSTIEAANREIEEFGQKADLEQAIIDLGVEYGLVTKHTSMVVLSEEMYAKRGVQRTNHKRLEVEHLAQQQRSQRAPLSRRVDNQEPMYSSNRPTHQGAGAIDPWFLLFLVPLFWLISAQRKKGENSSDQRL